MTELSKYQNSWKSFIKEQIDNDEAEDEQLFITELKDNNEIETNIENNITWIWYMIVNTIYIYIYIIYKD